MIPKGPADIGALPLRDELFSCEQLHRHAVSLASEHRIDAKRGSNRLLNRLADNERVLNEAYELVSSGELDSRQVSPAGEWLLDNFHLVEEQIRATRLHLPKTYSRELPRLLKGQARGFPRVYDIALELISHADGRVDAENIDHFIAAYQTVTPLTLGELWAIPIMLRLALIENLRRVSEHITRRRQDRDLAKLWAGRFLAVADQQAKVIYVLSEMAESDPHFSNPFVEEFSTRMYGQGPGLATVLSWVQHRLADKNLTREQLQRVDNQIQAADQVWIGYTMGSIRNLSAIDWRRFVETASAVEKTLRRDPAGIYAAMDFFTRDRYRHCIEALSRHSVTDEGVIAGEAIRLATEAARQEGSGASVAHVGYYLIGKGQPALERLLRMRFSLRRVLTRVARRAPVFCYVGSILTVTVALVLLLGMPVVPLGWQDWRLWLLAILAFVGASQMAVALVNLMTNLLIGTRPLPRLDFSTGIPKGDRTMVVVPTLLSSPAAVEELLENLELRYVGNRDPNLYFALLTDFCDAPDATQPDDRDLVEQVGEGIEALNSRHPREGNRVFHLFHRPRAWNLYERVWMGYERKRGKLEQFNELLRGGTSDHFSAMISDPALFPTIRYVITLDTDTSLPRDAAHKLVGTMAHPLNRPRFDPKTGRVVEGYSILQPRTPISLLAANQSLFARLSAGEAGIDPYSHEISDVYQDLFSEGSYVGKGIYDVDAFRRSTAGRFPENLILSHDLLECIHARSALVSDIELYEDHPASFTAEMSRRHRWIRGDWQIARWLFPCVPGPGNKRCSNPVSALGRWKILDNLRRSLVPPALLFLLLAGWLLVPQPAGLWTGFVILLLLLPVLLSALIDLARKPPQQAWLVHLETVMKGLGRHSAEVALTLASLPYRTLIHVDAILASAGRMLFTRRGLLLWHTRRYAKRNRCHTGVEYFGETWVAPFGAVVIGALLAANHPAELIVSGPLLLLWILFPVIGWWIGRPIPRKEPSLSDAQRLFLRSLARQTWRYFEVFANKEENWLAPDNFQQNPEPVVATRTSPTNIGMGLLANLSAHDLGYLSVGELLDRSAKALSSMERMEHHRGHLYNWYDSLPWVVSCLPSMSPPWTAATWSARC